MSNLYPVSSYNDEDMAAFDAPGECRHLLQGGVTTGRVLWLRGMKVTNSVAGAPILSLYDSNTEGASPAVTLERFRATIPATATTEFDFGSPGLKFVTGIIAGEVAALGGILAYDINIWGYEE